MASWGAQSDLLHTSSLVFPLDDIPSLSSTQLALVLFHLDATKVHVDCARIEFARRRDTWLNAELDRMRRGSEQPAVAAPRVCTPISPSLEPRDEAVARAVSPQVQPAPCQSPPRPSVGIKVKREIEEITLPDSDDDVVMMRAPPSPKAKQKSARETSSKRRKISPPAAPPSPASPARQENVSLRDQLKKLSCKPRKAAVMDDCMPFALPLLSASQPPSTAPNMPATPTTPPPKLAGPVAAPPALSRVSLASPVAQATALPRAAALEVSVDPRKRPSYSAAVPPPQATSKTAAPVPAAWPASTAGQRPAPPTSLSIDFLYRSSQPRASGTTVDTTIPHEPDREFWFRPPRPFPTFSPLSTEFPHVAEDVIPVELAGQLHTVCVRGLCYSVTRRLLLAFVTRNQHRLRPRVLAFRKAPHENSGVPEAVFYLAFRSEQDALLTIEGNNNRQLPHLDGARTIEMELVRAAKRLSPAAEDSTPQTPPSAAADAARKAQEGLKQELALKWTWGDLSDEVRTEWLASRALLHYRVCPQYEFEADLENGVLINDEYDDEVTHILKLKNREQRLRRKRHRPRIEERKLELYEDRCQRWLAWLKRPEAEREQALQDGEIEWPLWPDDAAVETY
ncbi:hypothetical protein JCM3774_000095 [Rhodotorula dairenensis]